jgi:uncharacterized membrane protein
MPLPQPRAAHVVTASSLIALIFLCLAWEGMLAPLKPGGSALVLKAVPLLLPVFGILRERLYTYRWTSLLALAYFCEGVVRTWSDTGVSRKLAIVEVVVATLLFAGCLWYVHARRRSA